MLGISVFLAIGAKIVCSVVSLSLMFITAEILFAKKYMLNIGIYSIIDKKISEINQFEMPENQCIMGITEMLISYF